MALNMSSRDRWQLHDTYAPSASVNRTVTRSQTGLLRIEMTPDQLELFSDRSYYEPPDQPHLMTYMKGRFGSVPRTTVTRSTGSYLRTSVELDQGLMRYRRQPFVREISRPVRGQQRPPGRTDTSELKVTQQPKTTDALQRRVPQQAKTTDAWERKVQQQPKTTDVSQQRVRQKPKTTDAWERKVPQQQKITDASEPSNLFQRQRQERNWPSAVVKAEKMETPKVSSQQQLKSREVGAEKKVDWEEVGTATSRGEIGTEEEEEESRRTSEERLEMLKDQERRRLDRLEPLSIVRQYKYR